MKIVGTFRSVSTTYQNYLKIFMWSYQTLFKVEVLYWLVSLFHVAVKMVYALQQLMFMVF